jgi:hypothetical protein
VAGETVVVACKIPGGIRLRLPALTHEEHMVKGPNVPWGREPIDAGTGYALTGNIPKEFWDKWWELNKDADYAHKRFIFAHSKGESARSETKELSKHRSGFEPIDQEDPKLGVTRADPPPS